MNPLQLVLVFTLTLTLPAHAKTYIEKWDDFAIGSTTSYWGWIQKNEQNANNDSLNDVKIEIIPHSSLSSSCLSLSGLANTELSGNTKTIKVCARQLRFILHLLDAFTTSIMITSGDSTNLKKSLSTGDTVKAERILLPSGLLLQAYSEYLRLKVKKDIQIIDNSQYSPLSACSADFFYMKMVMKQDFMNCDVDEQLSKQKEFDKWYYSPGGPGWIFSQEFKKETGQNINRTQVKAYWDKLHENINRAAIIFILMHEAGHITNGDLQQDTDAPHGLDAKAEARADLWAIKKMVEHNVFSPPEMLPYFLRIIIINVRYYDEYEPGKGPYKPSDSTMERLKSFNEYLEELSRLPVNNEKHRQQKNELIYLIKMQ